jgi:hypothetical protein
MRNNVIAIEKGRGNQTPLGGVSAYSSSGAAPATLPVVYAEVPDSHRTETRGVNLSPRDLYPEFLDDSRLLKALGLIERIRLILQGALSLDPSDDFFSFDQEVMKARALLEKVFRYREIGEGFAALINANIWALANRSPGSPSKRQINTILASLDRLANGPYMHFDTAMQVMDDLEGADLDIEPPSLDILISELDD